MTSTRFLIRCTLIAFLPLVVAALTGCTSSGTPRRPALINHVVLFKLHDPTDAAALIRDCDERLAHIPGITSYFCGQHLDTGRDTVDGNYDVGFFVGFDSEEDYAAYVVHDEHVAVVTKWRDRIDWYRVYDIADPTE